MIKTAYLRVYVPADRAGSWRSHVEDLGRRNVVRASDHYVWEESTRNDAFRVDWDGNTFLCPRFPRLRMLEGVLAFNTTHPGAMLLPERVIRDAADQLAELRSSRPDARSYILTSPWHVPLRWFIAFRPDQREIYETSGGTAIRYRTYVRDGLTRVEHAVEVLDESGFDDSVLSPVADLEMWLREFSGDAMLELDYAGVASLFSPADLALDESAEEIWSSIEALEEEDYERAGLSYAAVAGRWAIFQALTYVN